MKLALPKIVFALLQMTHLCVWGEAGSLKVKTKATPKITDRGVQCMFVEYAINYAGNTYQMWDPATSQVHETRDVIWMKWMFTPNQHTHMTLL
jgi:phage portal protein BeeE